MYLLIVFLPLLNFIYIYIFVNFLNKKELIFLCCCNIFISLISTIFGFYEVIYLKSVCYCYVLNWVDFNFIQLDWIFLFDSLSIIMCFIILLISFLVHLYSIEYMFNDIFILKFISYLSLFTFFMLFLVNSGNIVQLFFGWEGVGLSSYLLINFWNTRIAANKAAIKAIIVNRISDFALYSSLFIIFYLFKSFDIAVLFTLSKVLITFPELTFNNFFMLLNFACFFFFLGAMGKSAQIGLHTWLPDAMEGPTPVSALIHAATMVTAGIFLLIRLSFLFVYCPTVLVFILWIGSLTTFFAGSIGCFQHDIKKIIAYSTCSQLGYMTVSCGNFSYNIALFHLFNHAFFKALLFLGAGSIIHALFDEQDIRKYGGLHKLIPITYLSFVIASLAITGLPFLTGFYSKDLILEIEMYNMLYLLTINYSFFWVLSLFSVFFTIFYSLRIIYYSFFGYTNFIINASLIKESSFFIIFSLIVLSFFSIFIGFFTKDLFIGPGIDSFYNSTFINYYSDIILNIDFLFLFYKYYPIFINILSILIFFLLIIFFKKSNLLDLDIFDLWFYKFYRFFNQKWFFDIFYKFTIIFPILNWSYFITFKLIDRGFLEFFGSFTLVNFFFFFSKKISFWNTGLIYSYFFSFFFSIFFFLFIYLLFMFKSMINFKYFFLFFNIYHCCSILFFIFILIFINFLKNLKYRK